MSNKKIKPISIVFMGTPDFAVPSLEALIKNNRFKIISVVTQPDKKVGRKQIITPPPIKVLAKKNNISVLQPNKIKKISEKIKNLKPDIAVVVAYGQIIPANMLKIPKYGHINVHGSLLPAYRGAACIQAPILNGDKETGVTIMQIDTGLDTGAILSQNKIQILPEETAPSLHDKLSRLGAEVLPDVLFKYVQGNIKPKAQNDSKATYISQLKKEDGKIDWNKSAIEIERMVRALNPWPGTFFNCQLPIADFKIKILKVKNNILKINKYNPGELFINDNELTVQCGKDALIIELIQPEGKKAMPGKEFIQGYKSKITNLKSQI